MSKFAKLIEALGNMGNDPDVLMYGDITGFIDGFYEDVGEYDKDFADVRKQVEALRLLDAKNVAQEGGEGGGDSIWAVYDVPGEGLFKVEGWYASYAGCEFQEVYPCVPVEKTITVYEKKKRSKKEKASE